MKTKTLLNVFLILFFSATVCFAQEEEEDQYSSVFSNKQNSLNVLSSMSNTQLQNLPVVALQNSIFIQQIGNKNSAVTSIISDNSSINLNQFGNDNSIVLDKTANEINQFVLQDGNNNSVIDFNLNSNNSINSNFTQNGNNLNILSVGSNSISKDLTVKQSGNSGSVIILNN